MEKDPCQTLTPQQILVLPKGLSWQQQTNTHHPIAFR